MNLPSTLNDTQALARIDFESVDVSLIEQVLSTGSLEGLPEAERRYYDLMEMVRGLRARLKFNDKVPVRSKGVMEKCSLCLHRLQDDRLEVKTAGGVWRGRGVNTACAEACPKKAIVFGNWLDPESPLVKLARRRDLYAPADLAGLDPSIVYMMGGK